MIDKIQDTVNFLKAEYALIRNHLTLTILKNYLTVMSLLPVVFIGWIFFYYQKGEIIKFATSKDLEITGAGFLGIHAIKVNKKQLKSTKEDKSKNNKSVDIEENESKDNEINFE